MLRRSPALVLLRCTNPPDEIKKRPETLPEHFDRVATGKEFRLTDEDEPVWEKPQEVKYTWNRMLTHLACICPMVRASDSLDNPPGLRPAWKAFTNPPCTTPGDHTTTVCMPLVKSNGVYPSGIYFNILLGRDACHAPVQIGAHRLVCWLIRGEAPGDKLLACHACHTTGCVNPLHLYWGSPHDNATDKFSTRARKRKVIEAISPNLKRRRPL